MEREVPLSPQKKVFRRGDGLVDNVWLPRSVVRDRMKAMKTVFVTFVDVAKAFDSVSHYTMILAARRVGIPDRLLAYIKSLYSGTETRQGRGQLRSPIRVARGVRQGDPLSPLLFNYVMDWILTELDPDLGIKLEDSDTKLNHLAFADNVSLITSSCMAANMSLLNLKLG